MYILTESEQHVRTSVQEAILLLCQTGLKFNTELSVDGLLAVTVDKKHVFLVSINETLQASVAGKDIACQQPTTDNEAVLNFSSKSISADTSDDQSLSNELLYIQNGTDLRLTTDMPTDCANDSAQLGHASVTKSDQTCRRRQRKQQRTVRRFLDASCQRASPSPLSLSSHSEHALDWSNSENCDAPACGKGEDEHCKSDLHSDVSDMQEFAPLSLTSANSDTTDGHTFSDICDQKGKAVSNSSLGLPLRGQKRCKSEMPVSPPLSNKEFSIKSEHTSKRSHRKRRHTVERYLNSSTCPTASSSTMLLHSSQTQHPSEWVSNANAAEEAAILDKFSSGQCKLESSNSDETSCQDLSISASCHTLSNVKAEISDACLASTDTMSQLTTVDHDIQPSSSDRQQQLALMSQYDLTSVVNSMHSQLALLPRPFPWSVNTFPSVSPLSLPSSQSGMFITPTSTVSVKTNGKGCQKTPLNVPTINSYRRLNGIKSSPFLSPELNVCANCGVTRTTVWRRLENKQILCNACGCYYKLHKVHRPLSLVRQEIRARCRGPKVSTLTKSLKSRFNGVVTQPTPPPDVALNLTLSPHKEQEK